MKITADHYVVLWGLFHAGQFATDNEVVWKSKTEFKVAIKCLWHMTQRDFCDGDPWIDLRKKNGLNRWFITGRRGDGDVENTGGWAALVNSSDHPSIIQFSDRYFRDEALTGLTAGGFRSKITHAVLNSRG